MDWILLIASCTVLVAIILVLMRAIAGPTVYDRILAVNAIGTKTIGRCGLFTKEFTVITSIPPFGDSKRPVRLRPPSTKYSIECPFTMIWLL